MTRGQKHTEETKEKIRKKLKGKLNPMFGRNHTEKAKQKVSKANKGKHYSPETEYKKGMISIFKGKKHTKEAKKKMSLKKKGKTYEEQVGKEKAIQWKTKESLARKGKRNCNYGKEMPQMRGEKHPNWKGGITPLKKQIRDSFKYRQWRSDIFTRDDFTCVLCGERGVRLEADHHPKRFSQVLEEYQIKTLEQALNCEELWNINNGRTLCRECHKLYGTYR